MYIHISQMCFTRPSKKNSSNPSFYLQQQIDGWTMLHFNVLDLSQPLNKSSFASCTFCYDPGVLLKKYSEPLGSTNWRMRHPNRKPSSSNPGRREGHASPQWRAQRKIPQSIFKKQLKLKCSFEIVSLTHLIADYFPHVSPILCVAWWLAGCWRNIFQETRRRKVLWVANMHKMFEPVSFRQ